MNISLDNLVQIAARQNISDAIFHQISKLIIDGTIPAGYVFPNETVLGEQLHVGRSTIREAYKALELSGYITRTKRGTMVNNKMDILSASPLKLIADQASDQEFFDFRLMLESQTAYAAATEHSLEEIQQLQDKQNELIEAKANGEFEKLQEVDHDFHEMIARSSKNPLLIASMTAVTDNWNEKTTKNFQHAIAEQPALLEDMVHQHQAILDAIQNENADAAREAMRLHVLHMSHRMIERAEPALNRN